MYKEQCYSLTHKYLHCMIYVVSIHCNILTIIQVKGLIFGCPPTITRLRNFRLLSISYSCDCASNLLENPQLTLHAT